MNMGPQMIDPMMAGMGGEMGMDGVGVGAPQQAQGGPMPDQLGTGVEGFGPQGGIGVGMGMTEYGIQDQSGMQQLQQQQQQQQQMQPQQLQQQQQQHMYQNMEAPVAPSPPVGPSRGIPFRGPRGAMMRGGRGYMLRGRGGHPTPPVRPASPLPPNVPTGPRNQNKYKDRDNNAQAVDGLDYGGGGFGVIDRGSTTPVTDYDDRTGRKRRDRSPTDDRREPKRR